MIKGYTLQAGNIIKGFDLQAGNIIKGHALKQYSQRYCFISRKYN